MDPTSRHFSQAWELLGQALELTPEDRPSFLIESCGGDETLRRQVESLLAAAGVSAGILDRPLEEAAAALLRDLEDGEALPGAPSADTPIGPYRLLRELGRGGMGVIFLADRAEGGFQQCVALKLIKKGLDSEEIVSRFLRERQILARLHHPHIARLLDGGLAADGRPYFAMEYVEGEPLLAYCDKRKLGIEARLELFLDACSAVQYAHRSLVIHRDLKPSNILVTSDGQAKLLDFGIASLLRGEGGQGATDLTREGPRPMTPEYASPEQLRGEPATTATDVYALGVVLYELLAGRLPNRPSEGPSLAIQKSILETHPVPPSQAVTRMKSGSSDPGPAAARGTTPERLRRRLSGDLDVIVLAALKREPERRYASVEALAQDIRRHLDGLPVLARKDTLGYRSRKFILRHRLGVATAVLILLSILAGLLGTLWQARSARREALKAETVKDFMVSIFKVSDPSESKGEQITARELLDRGAERIDRELGSQPEVRAEMLRIVGEVYTALGVLESGEGFLRRALELDRRLAGGGNQAEVAVTLDLLGAVLQEKGNFAAAKETALQALSLTRTTYGPNHPQVGRCLTTLGSIEASLGNYQESERYHREALAIDRAAQRGDHLEIAADLHNLANTLHAESRDAEAEGYLREALAMRIRLRGEESPEAAFSMNDLGLLLFDRNNAEEGMHLLQESIRIKKKVYGPEHAEVQFSLSNLGAVMTDLGRYQEAADMLAEALDLHRKALGDSHPEIARDHNNLAVALYRLGRFGEASREFALALGIWRPALGRDHPSVATATNNQGMCEREIGNLEPAERLVREGLEGRINAHSAESVEVSQSLRNLGLILTDERRYLDAGETLSRSLELARKLYPPENFRIAEVLAAMGRLRIQQGRPAQAEALLLEALSTFEKQFGKEDLRFAEAEMLLGSAYTLQNDFPTAQPFLVGAVALREQTAGKDSTAAAEARSYLVPCLAGLGRREEAGRLAAAVMSALTRQLGENHWMVRQARARMGSVLSQRIAASD